MNLAAGKSPLEKILGNDEVYDLGLKSANIYQVGLKSKWNMVDFGKSKFANSRAAKILQMQSKLNSSKSALEQLNKIYSKKLSPKITSKVLPFIEVVKVSLN